MYTKICNVAIEAAKAAASIHLKYFKGGFSSESKSAHHDIVTSADIDSEKEAVKVIRKYFPEHNFLAEEHTYQDTGSEFLWIIDPLDGTNNFFKGIPHFSVSIGVAHNGKLVAGVVIDSTRQEIFHAIHELGAFLNNMPIKVGAAESLRNAMLFTGFHYDRGKPMRQTLEAIEDFFEAGTMGIRRSGSAALDLCYVACGRSDGFWEHYLSPWDTAAGAIIIREAGGRITNLDGTPLQIHEDFVVASNTMLHPLLLEKLSGIYTNTDT